MEKQLSFNLEQTVAGMVEEFSTTAEQPKNIPTSARLIKEEYQEWLDEYNDTASRPENELKELGDLVYVIYGYARAKGFNLVAAVKAIHENNMGRMRHPCDTCRNTRYLTRECDECSDKGYVIKRREDGKILKNPDYPKVDLSQYVS